MNGSVGALSRSLSVLGLRPVASSIPQYPRKKGFYPQFTETTWKGFERGGFAFSGYEEESDVS